jgi:hypothetical protein
MDMSQFARTESTPSTSNGTAREIIDLGPVAIDPTERIGNYHEVRQDIKRTAESNQDARDRIEAEQLTPSSHVLREMARKSPPPQEWWDEDFEGL